MYETTDSKEDKWVCHWTSTMANSN